VEPAEADPAPHTPKRLPHNLPLELSSFVGREKEIAEVKELLADHRLLTLTGPGGCGKKRLALAAREELVERGVEFIHEVGGSEEDGSWATFRRPDGQLLQVWRPEERYKMGQQ
jgi:hypothetical protein